MNEDYEDIRAKAMLRLPLTKKERAIWLLFIATKEEMYDYLIWEFAQEHEDEE